MSIEAKIRLILLHVETTGAQVAEMEKQLEYQNQLFKGLLHHHKTDTPQVDIFGAMELTKTIIREANPEEGLTELKTLFAEFDVPAFRSAHDVVLVDRSRLLDLQIRLTLLRAELLGRKHAAFDNYGGTA